MRNHTSSHTWNVCNVCLYVYVCVGVCGRVYSPVWHTRTLIYTHSEPTDSSMYADALCGVTMTSTV